MDNEAVGDRYESVWDALADSPAEAANLRLRSDLMIAIRASVAGWDLSQLEAAERLGVTRPRLEDLQRGCIDKFDLDALVGLAERSGVVVTVVRGTAERGQAA